MNSFPLPDVRRQKQELRLIMDAKRKDAATHNPEAAAQLCSIVLQNMAFPKQSIIASYHARGAEIDPSPLTDELRNRGHVIALPVMNGEKAPLLFRRHEAGDILAPGHFGLHEPLPNAPLLEPDILLVPLLAFDQHKGRLGYGGGYYDRTLTILRQCKIILALGIAYSCQEVLEIPMGSYDAKLDKVATELQIF